MSILYRRPFDAFARSTRAESGGPFSLCLFTTERKLVFIWSLVSIPYSSIYAYIHVHCSIVLRAAHGYRGLPPGPLYLVPRRVVKPVMLLLSLLSTPLPDPPPLPSKQPFQPSLRRCSSRASAAIPAWWQPSISVRRSQHNRSMYMNISVYWTVRSRYKTEYKYRRGSRQKGTSTICMFT